MSFSLYILRHFTFFVLERLVPAKNEIWCFCTWPHDYPHTMDNPRAVFEEIKNDPTITKVIFAHRNNFDNVSLEGSSVIIVEKESFKGAYYLARSRVILTGYAIKGLCSYSKWLTRKHLIIQLWHGIPLKRIGKLFSGESHWDSETHLYAATVCSSDADKEKMHAAFSPIPIERVWQTGLPRNDLILKPEKELPIDYSNWLEELRKRVSGRKLILYAPTWREAKEGAFTFSSEQKKTLEALLDSNNAVFAIRGHANEDANSSDKLQTQSPIIYVNDIPDVSVLLRETDLLITDYSSIYIDFLITGKPILHFVYDLESYISERGFLYDFERACGGDMFKSFEDLTEKLSSYFSGELVSNETYKNSSNLFHQHANSPSREVTIKIKELYK